MIRPIGHGAYGVVISALDKKTNQKVAIKKISRAFEDPVDAKRILREIKLMKQFTHENVRIFSALLSPVLSLSVWASAPCLFSMLDLSFLFFPATLHSGVLCLSAHLD